MARRLGARVYALPEDIVEVRKVNLGQLNTSTLLLGAQQALPPLQSPHSFSINRFRIQGFPRKHEIWKTTLRLLNKMNEKSLN